MCICLPFSQSGRHWGMCWGQCWTWQARLRSTDVGGGQAMTTELTCSQRQSTAQLPSTQLRSPHRSPKNQLTSSTVRSGIGCSGAALAQTRRSRCNCFLERSGWGWTQPSAGPPTGLPLERWILPLPQQVPQGPQPLPRWLSSQTSAVIAGWEAVFQQAPPLTHT